MTTTTPFMVTLNTDIRSDEQGSQLHGRIDALKERFVEGQEYPVLAVEYRPANTQKTTFYHITDKNGKLAWYASDFFLFSKVV